MLFAEKKPRDFGIDVSENSIKIMQLENRRGGIVPVAFSRVELPPLLVNNHQITDEAKLAEYVMKAVRSAKNLSGSHVVANVMEAKSFIRTLKMPRMGEAEMAGAIPWEMEQDIPVPIDQVYMDWEVVKEEGDDMFVTVTASPRDYVDSLVRVLKLAKLRPVALELESRAAARALMLGQQPVGSTMVIDISAPSTSFVIVSPQGNIEYTSSIELGGDRISENISKDLGIPLKDADKLKRENGLLSDNKKGNPRQSIFGVLDATIEELQNVIRYHGDHIRIGGKIEDIVLTGGGSALPGIADYFSARMNISSGRTAKRIFLGNPMAGLAVGRAGVVPAADVVSYATAIGLALRRFQK